MSANGGGALTSGYVAMQAGASVEPSIEGSQEPLIALAVNKDMEESLLASEKSDTLKVAEVAEKAGKIQRTRKGSTTKDVDAAWYVFDNLSCDQAEDLLRRHGDHGTYLIAHFHDPESYGLSIRLSEGGDMIFKHYAIGISGSEYRAEGVPGNHPNIESIVIAVSNKMSAKLIPIFHRYNCETCEYSISLSAEEPPDYTVAQRYPQAAKRPLPLIVPIRPTLRRMMGSGQRSSFEESVPEMIERQREEERERGICWKLFHTDTNGYWYKPHKAGYITAFFLVIGWIIFLVLFGWIVALALILVFILVIFAYLLNFLCTGRCQIEEDD